MEFYMVRHYIYNGEGRHDDDVVIPYETSEEAMAYLEGMDRNLTDFDFETSGDGFKILMRRGPGQYAYDYYYIEEMTMGEEI